MFEMRRCHCRRCGARFESDAAERVCPLCGNTWTSAGEPSTVPGLAALLDWIEHWRSEQLLDQRSYEQLTRRYRARLDTAHLEAHPPAPIAPAEVSAAATEPLPAAPEAPLVAPPAGAAEPHALTPAVGPRQVAPRLGVHEGTPPRPGAPPLTARPSRPARPPSVDLTQWAAERQADILLYLGAFLLVAAAIVFVNYRGSAFTAEGRVAVLALYTASFVTAGLLVRRWDRVREAGPVFLMVGALFTPLNFVLLDVEILDRRGVPNDVMWLIGAGYSGLFYSVLASRGYGRIYAIPAGPALLIGWGALASVLQLPADWAGSWYLALATGVTAIAVNREFLRPWLLALMAILAALSTISAQGVASETAAQAAQLPVAYALLTAWLAIVGWDRRVGLALPAAATSATAAAIAAMWAVGLGPEWYGYPVVALGGLVIATYDRWAKRSGLGDTLIWGYATLVAVGPLALSPVFVDHGWHGAAAYLGGAAVLAGITWRDRAGDLLRDLFEQTDEAAKLLERIAFGWSAFAMLLLSIGFGQRGAGIERPETGWAYLAASLAVILAMALVGRRHEWGIPALFWPAMVAMGVSLQPWATASGHDAVLIGAPAAAVAAAAVLTKRWSLVVAAVILGAASAAAAWSALDWPTWTLAVAFGAVGVAWFLALTSYRRYSAQAAELWIIALSWGLPIAAPIAAFVALQLREADQPATVAVETVEYRAMMFLALALAPLIAFEGRRLHSWQTTAAATGWASLVAYGIWPAFDWPTWSLAITFAALGGIRFAMLTPIRTYRRKAAASLSTSQAWIVAISWGPLLLGPATAYGALADRLPSDLAATELVEYRVLTALLAALAAPVLFEAWRFRSWNVTAVAHIPAAVSAALFWPIMDWPTWSLGVTYWVAGSALFFGLARKRVYEANVRQIGILLLSWAPLALGIAVVFGAVVERADTAAAIAETIEYRVLVLLLLASVGHLVYEARRLRNWNVAVMPAALGAIGLAVAWPALDWPIWTLGPVYAAIGSTLLLGLTPYRQYQALVSGSGGDEEAPRAKQHEPAVALLSWGFLALALMVAYGEVASELGERWQRAVRSSEYYSLTALVAATGVAVAYEGWRLRQKLVLLGATTVGLVALLMTIAITRPENVQAFTIPTALFLLAVGLIVRRSPPVVANHVLLHEVATIAGALVLVLPQAEQSFDPAGATWGFVLLGEGAALILTAFLLRGRWHAVAGVFTISGVGIRWIAENGDTIPYWVTLGVAGMLLIALGTSLLLNREWWDRTARRTADWWEQSPLSV